MWKERCTSSRDDHSLERIVRKRPFKSVGELHKDWTEAGVSASRDKSVKWALYVVFLLSSHS